METKINKYNLFVWFLAIFAISLFVIEKKQTKNPINHSYHNHSSNKFLFKDQGKMIIGVEIILNKKQFQFKKNKDNNWYFIFTPPKNKSNLLKQDVTDKLNKFINVFLRTRVERSFKNSLLNDKFGINKSKVSILVYTHNQPDLPIQEITFGDIAPDNLSRYIRSTSLRKLSDANKVYTIPNYQYDIVKSIVELVVKEIK